MEDSGPGLSIDEMYRSALEAGHSIDEVERMTLRHYFLSQQAHARRLIREQHMVEAQTLPILNTLLSALDAEPVQQLFGPNPGRTSKEMTEDERRALVTFRHDAAQMKDEDGSPLIDDWSLVDKQLRNN